MAADKTTLKYTPEEIKVHENALKHLGVGFRDLTDGLPEWAKNSAMAYLRQEKESDKAREERPDESSVGDIVVFFRSSGGKKGPSLVACLDFVGMTSTEIEEDFGHWGKPEAASRGLFGREEYGELTDTHGHGGKSYMGFGFADHSYFVTVKNGKGCRYAVPNDSVRFGYVPDPKIGKDFDVPNVRRVLEKELKAIGVDISGLPKPVVACASQAQGFTLTVGIGPHGYDKGRFPVKAAVDGIVNHHAMGGVLDCCNVYVIHNGKPYNHNGGQTLSFLEIDPEPGFEEPRQIPVPETLTDPDTGKEVQTTKKGAPKGKLILYTSEKNLNLVRSSGLKSRHRISYYMWPLEGSERKHGPFLGHTQMKDFGIQSPFVFKIYGELFLDSLKPHKKTERGPLANVALTRAIVDWIKKELEQYIKIFEKREKLDVSQSAKAKVMEQIDWLDVLKNQVLMEYVFGLSGPGGTKTKKLPLPPGKPSKIEITPHHVRAGVGVAFQPSIYFFDKNEKRIEAVPFRWVSEDNNVGMVLDDLNLVQTFAFGETYIYAETLKGGLKSNKISLEVVHIYEIKIEPDDLLVNMGSRGKLEAFCKLSSGEVVNNVKLVWMEDNIAVARVSSGGFVYGHSVGETIVQAEDEVCKSVMPARIRVVEVGDEGDSGRGDKSNGKGFPTFKLSSYHSCPLTGDEVTLSSDIPSVWQRPEDDTHNIWWINSHSPSARLYLDREKGYGEKSREWRIYLLERVIDILIEIALKHGPEKDISMVSSSWIMDRKGHEADLRGRLLGYGDYIENFINNDIMGAL